MKKPLIIANWKMNPATTEDAVFLASRVEKVASALRGVDVVLAVPFPFIFLVNQVLKRVRLAAQNMFWEGDGPYTGEVSWKILKNMGVSHVVLGHSERRKYLLETDEVINKKISSALNHGLVGVLCVGENERIDGEIPQVVGDQIQADLRGILRRNLKNLVVAYEPVWAISTNKNAKSDTPDNAFRARLFIQKILTQSYDRASADAVTIIYGGSVNSSNINGFLNEGKMDGALVGGASLRFEDFEKILYSSAKSILDRKRK